MRLARRARAGEASPHMISVLRCAAVSSLLLVMACGPSVRDAETESTATGPRPDLGGGGSGMSLATTSSGSITSSDESTTWDGHEVQECGVNYPNEHCDVDWATRHGKACNWWLDDCGPTAACNLIDQYGEVACEAVPANPRLRYEPCERHRDCDKGLFCAGGSCAPRCKCSEAWPHCEDETTVCLLTGDDFEGAFCSSPCDPASPACPEPGAVCSVRLTFPVCGYDSYAGLLEGDACDAASFETCAEGLFCTEGAAGCTASECCARICLLDAPDACADLGPDVKCYGPLQDGRPCYDGYGVCRLDS
jgi:hypothetical protein